jgi:hypothetical protein
VTLRCDAIPERIAYARELRKLPAVLSADEVVRFREAVSSLEARVALTTQVWGNGLTSGFASHTNGVATSGEVY